MGKRSSFERIDRDAYATPASAIEPLLPHLPKGSRFIEPCAGEGALHRYLELAGHVCVFACDITDYPCYDARTRNFRQRKFDGFITHPPWDRPVLHAIIDNLAAQKPAWLLLDADWAHTRQAAPYIPQCRLIVSVGRVRWFAGTPHAGKDNVCWYLLDASWNSGPRFVGRPLATRGHGARVDKTGRQLKLPDTVAERIIRPAGFRRTNVMTETIARLPVPSRLEPKQSSRTLMLSVRGYFYSLWNASSATFRDLCASVGNKDAKTGNRLFDRHVAVGMVKEQARKAEDRFTVDALDGDIYACIVRLMRSHQMGLKLRRSQYRQLTHTTEAAE